jgi:hypothetical protein
LPGSCLLLSRCTHSLLLSLLRRSIVHVLTHSQSPCLSPHNRRSLHPRHKLSSNYVQTFHVTSGQLTTDFLLLPLSLSLSALLRVFLSIHSDQIKYKVLTAYSHTHCSSNRFRSNRPLIDQYDHLFRPTHIHEAQLYCALSVSQLERTTSPSNRVKMPASLFHENQDQLNQNIQSSSGTLEDNRALQLALELSMLGMIGEEETPMNAALDSEAARLKKSQNTTECVPVPSSEHVAEIVGRQGQSPIPKPNYSFFFQLIATTLRIIVACLHSTSNCTCCARVTESKGHSFADCFSLFIAIDLQNHWSHHLFAISLSLSLSTSLTLVLFSSSFQLVQL